MLTFGSILVEAEIEEGPEKPGEHSEMEGLCRTEIAKPSQSLILKR